MLRSLVGSEMCIRDSPTTTVAPGAKWSPSATVPPPAVPLTPTKTSTTTIIDNNNEKRSVSASRNRGFYNTAAKRSSRFPGTTTRWNILPDLPERNRRTTESWVYESATWKCNFRRTQIKAQSVCPSLSRSRARLCARPLGFFPSLICHNYSSLFPPAR